MYTYVTVIVDQRIATAEDVKCCLSSICEFYSLQELK